MLDDLFCFLFIVCCTSLYEWNIFITLVIKYCDFESTGWNGDNSNCKSRTCRELRPKIVLGDVIVRREQ
jgi:hypothetical protein